MFVSTLGRGIARTAILSLAALLPTILTAQTSTSGQQGSQAAAVAAPFLLISPDARSAALGEAGVAITNNANAVYWNPAALAFNENQWGINLNYTPWLRNLIPDINHYYLPGFYNLGERNGVIAASFTYFNLGRIQFTNATGGSLGEAVANEWAATVAYSRKIAEKLSVGVSLKYIYSNLAGDAPTFGGPAFEPGTSFAGDIGLMYRSEAPRQGDEYSLAMTLTNLGAKMNYRANDQDRDFLPATLKVGGSYKYSLDETNSVLFTADISKQMVPRDTASRREDSVVGGVFSSFGETQLGDFTIGGGAEYWYNNIFAARLGYFHESERQGNRKYVSLGVGFKYEKFALDFSFLQPTENQHPLQNTIRFTIGYAVGQE